MCSIKTATRATDNSYLQYNAVWTPFYKLASFCSSSFKSLVQNTAKRSTRRSDLPATCLLGLLEKPLN